MRFFYSLLYIILLPAAVLLYAFRSNKNPAYRHNMSERFAYRLPPKQQKRPIHFHVVSVGEVIAASAIVERIHSAYPDVPLLITVTTPTGRAQAELAFKQIEHKTICYLPFDLKIFMLRFLEQCNPFVSIIMETEVWPNFIHVASDLKVPTVLLNARMSKKSFRGYKRFYKNSTTLFSAFELVLAQFKPDYKRLIALGCKPSSTHITGNIKFDLSLPRSDELEEKWRTFKPNRPVWIAVSTHNNEEEQILSVHQRLLEHFPDVLLIMVPRHKERFDHVANIVEKRGLSLSRRSKDEVSKLSTTNVFLGDSLGEMFNYLTLADIAFVGGSLIKRGGHNPLEPAAMGLPIVTGEHVFNFKSIYKECRSHGFCSTVHSTNDLQECISDLLSNEAKRRDQSQAARSYVNRNRGALEMSQQHIVTFLNDHQV